MKSKHLAPWLGAGALLVGWLWVEHKTTDPRSDPGSVRAEHAGAVEADARRPPRKPRIASRRHAIEDASEAAEPGEPPTPADPSMMHPDDSTGPSEEVRIAMEHAPSARSTSQQRARAAEQRDRELAKLEASGVDAGPWSRALGGVRAELEQLARQVDFDAAVSDLQCYRAGCYLHVQQADERAAQVFAAHLQRSSSVSEWHGGAFSSGTIETDSGRVETTVVFFAPGTPSSWEG